MKTTVPVCKATVAVCTFNGRDRIGGVVRALAVQSFPAGEWELLVIDNASTDDTRGYVEGLMATLLPGTGRVVFEAKPGLSFARARAAAEARGEVLLFLDDDTVPATDWVEMAVGSFRDNPRAGVIGGRVLPRWEVQPTALAEAVAPYALAICEGGDERRLISGAFGGVVGAGMCVRTAVLREIYDDPVLPALVTDRKGSNLISGGDLAICLLVRQKGWECWYEPAMVIEHLLPASRMRKEYLLRLYEGIGRGEAATRKLYDWKARTALSWAIGFKDLVRWCIGRVRGGPTDAVGIAGDVRDLEERRTLGRAMQALRWPRN